MDFHDAFVLWRGLNIDYEGGVLDNPARMAIHFTHRIGAAVTALTLLTLGVLTLTHARSRRHLATEPLSAAAGGAKRL